MRSLLLIGVVGPMELSSAGVAVVGGRAGRAERKKIPLPRPMPLRLKLRHRLKARDLTAAGRNVNRGPPRSLKTNPGLHLKESHAVVMRMPMGPARVVVRVIVGERARQHPTLQKRHLIQLDWLQLRRN